MPEPKDKDTTADAAQAVEKASQKVTETVDKETAQGYRGTVTDPTPNENYTVAGVTSGKPTPENDPKAAEAARAAIGLASAGMAVIAAQ
jgi:hypothetical protein